MPDPSAAFDVAIIGGGTSGAALAVLLLQKQPSLRVAIFERDAAFAGRPGQALPELAAFFLGRVLGLGAHLNEEHYHRHGARFWFTDGDPAQAFDASSEIGGKYLARLPAYLIDHAILDEELLRRAGALGAEIRRPAAVRRVELEAGSVTLDSGETVRARWVIDASGAAALIARQQGWRRTNASHPIRAVWGRFRGVKDWDSQELRRKYPAWSAASFGMRNPAINYLTGDRWWSGWTPVRGGEVTISVTGASGELPTSPAEIRAFLEARHPVARELLAGAALVEGSGAARDDLAFCSERIFGDGFALVGGAAGFMDTLYGTDLDWMTSTVTAAAQRILGAASPPPDLPAVYARWFDALHRDKYEYLGEFDLMSIAYLFDLGLSHLGVVRPAYREGLAALTPFAAPSRFASLLRLVNRRCAHIARVRRAQGTLGRSNANRRLLFTSFNFNPTSAAPLLGALRRWLFVELTEGWRQAP